MRPEGWESLLHEHFEEARGKPFSWGTHDCVLWSASWIERITGLDLAAKWRGTYETEEQAKTVLDSLGFKGTAELASHYLPEVPVRLAQRGDIMLHPSGALGICGGAIALFVTERGILRTEFSRCLQAWKV